MKGLAFIPEMAIAALAGRKTMTRRVIVPQPSNWAKEVVLAPCVHLPGYGCDRDVLEAKDDWSVARAVGARCEYVTGEERCLLTTWAVGAMHDRFKPSAINPDWILPHLFWHAGMGPKPTENWWGKSRAGRFLPNSLRHLMPKFKIGGVRIERVASISAEDALAEGIDHYVPGPTAALRGEAEGNPIEEFSELWDGINHVRGYGWSVNPWVYAVGFKLA